LYLEKTGEESHPQMVGRSGGAGSRDVRYQANQEQNDEDEEANSSNLSSGESYNSKTEDAGQECDYEEDQRVVQHDDSFLFTGFEPANEHNQQVLCQRPSPDFSISKL
jgi:hypothetical protein